MPGIIESYVHTGNQTGVLVEINCQNRVTATTLEFKNLAKEIALQVVANPQVVYIKSDDIPSSVIKKIRQESQEPETLEQKITNICLYDQVYIRDNSITIEDLLKLHIAQLSEQITVGRFVRFVIDESNPNYDNYGGVISPNSPNPAPYTQETESN